MGKRLYLIIDMQNDYCHTAGFYSRRDGSSFTMNYVADRIVKFYNKLILAGQNVVCFAMQYIKPEPYELPCKPGTFGAEYYGIIPSKLYIKNEFSCFTNRAFTEYITEHAITELVVMGFQTCFCVYETIKDAIGQGLYILLPRDLVGERSIHQFKTEEVFNKVTMHGGKITSLAELEGELLNEQSDYGDTRRT